MMEKVIQKFATWVFFRKLPKVVHNHMPNRRKFAQSGICSVSGDMYIGVILEIVWHNILLKLAQALYLSKKWSLYIQD
jgi:hypothetical protein